ncbi:MAG: DegV family protein [Lachnospiraceae bacterium]|nr:DegV family protein [Lachnospiraceae bacterium]
MKTAILTDSSCGMTQKEAKELGVYMLPMPFYINDELYYEEVDLSQDEFYEKLLNDVNIKTSQPLPGDVMDMWESLLKEYDEIVYIPLSSGLSGSAEAAKLWASEYDGKIVVVDNQRVSVTLRSSVRDAKIMADKGKSAKEICKILEKTKLESSIYIMVDTLSYLSKGGRLTPAAAAIGTLLKIKPVLQIHGEKLDAFAKARSVKHAKATMLEAVEKDMKKRFKNDECEIAMAYTHNPEDAEIFKAEVVEKLGISPEDIVMNPLALNIACHIGPGALALTVSKKLNL